MQVIGQAKEGKDNNEHVLWSGTEQTFVHGEQLSWEQTGHQYLESSSTVSIDVETRAGRGGDRSDTSWHCWPVWTSGGTSWGHSQTGSMAPEVSIPFSCHGGTGRVVPLHPRVLCSMDMQSSRQSPLNLSPVWSRHVIVVTAVAPGKWHKVTCD